MSQIYFTSDLHFSHKNIAKFCPQFRPAAPTLEELDEYMIARWNETVQPEDTVYNLGDVSFAHDLKKIEAILRRLNGQHHLILGNHDDLISRNKKRFLDTSKADGNPMLSSIRSYQKIQLPEINNTLILFHYPINEWDGCHKGWYHLYGHLHDRVAPMQGRALNVGWDLHGRLLTPQDIDDYLRALPIIQRFDDRANTIAGSDVNDAAAQIRAKLAEFNA